MIPGASGVALDAPPVPVRIVYNGSFLLTVHSGPCLPLEQARARYNGLGDQGQTNGPLVLFLAMDELVGSFEPHFLALDSRLDDIQVELLTSSSSRDAQAELLTIRRRLSDAYQSLGWYTGTWTI